MPFVKVLKTRAYFKRYQVKYRRRREGKTDYAARRALVVQDKNKYQSPKYRLVVRLTNHYVICQVVAAELVGDRVLASAYSSELPRYGVKVGLKNYTAAYLTGLLVARRLLSKLGMADKYEGNEPTGEVISTKEGKRTFYVKELDEERKPFRAYLDVGIRATTTGARVFGAMKGAVDGGLDIPHNFKRFPGYMKEAKKYSSDDMRARITGEHVKEYMEWLAEEDQEAYEKRFSKYIEEGVDEELIEEYYSKAAEAIRADPAPAPKSTFKWTKEFAKPAKKTLEERKASVAEKKAARAEKLRAALDGDDE